MYSSLLFSNKMLPSGDDFTSSSVTITVPANSQVMEIPQFFTVLDDDINEDEQNFAIVAEIGPDVPDGVVCFQTRVGETECHGQRGATEIRIRDNDGKLCITLLYILYFIIDTCAGILCVNVREKQLYQHMCFDFISYSVLCSKKIGIIVTPHIYLRQ